MDDRPTSGSDELVVGISDEIAVASPLLIFRSLFFYHFTLYLCRSKAGFGSCSVVVVVAFSFEEEEVLCWA